MDKIINSIGRAFEKAAKTFAKYIVEKVMGIIRWFQDPKSIYFLISLLCVLPAVLICTFMGDVALAFSRLTVELSWMGVTLFAAFLVSVANAISSLAYPKARSAFKLIMNFIISIIFIFFAVMICVGFYEYFQTDLKKIGSHYVSFAIFIISIIVTLGGCIGMFIIRDKNYIKEKN